MKILIDTFENHFEQLHLRAESFVKNTPHELLFTKFEAAQIANSGYSCAELILRSTAAVEQAFGGITTSLWDDPFEWTLLEELSTANKILGYFNEVRATRNNGFKFFKFDEELYKEIPAPEELKTLAKILVETIARAENLFGQAQAISQKTRWKN